MATDPEWFGVDSDEEARLESAVDRAREAYASFLLAEDEGLDPEACGRWVDQIYDPLRAALTPEDRLVAIVMLLLPSARNRADQIRRSLEVR